MSGCSSTVSEVVGISASSGSIDTSSSSSTTPSSSSETVTTTAPRADGRCGVAFDYAACDADGAYGGCCSEYGYVLLLSNKSFREGRKVEMGNANRV